MATLVVDTHRFIERLVREGFPETQARAIADGLREIDLNHIATKEDILLLKNDFEAFKVDLLKWLVPILLGQAGLIVALVKLL